MFLFANMKNIFLYNVTYSQTIMKYTNHTMYFYNIIFTCLEAKLRFKIYLHEWIKNCVPFTQCNTTWL